MPVKKAEFPVNKSENDRGTHQPQEEPYFTLECRGREQTYMCPYVTLIRHLHGIHSTSISSRNRQSRDKCPAGHARIERCVCGNDAVVAAGVCVCVKGYLEA